MGDLPSQGVAVAPRSTALLPVAFLLHVCEEWFGGFSRWTGEIVGVSIGAERFLIINTIGFLVLLVGTFAARRRPGFAWLAAVAAALLGLNGLLHALATLGLGRYSPGVITGLLLYVPLSAVMLRTLALQLPRGVFVRSVIFGVTLHVAVTFLAFL